MTDNIGKQLADAALANVEDDTPLLIYADWLEEQGDEKAMALRATLKWRCWRFGNKVWANPITAVDIAPRKETYLQVLIEPQSKLIRGATVADQLRAYANRDPKTTVIGRSPIEQARNPFGCKPSEKHLVRYVFCYGCH